MKRRPPFYLRLHPIPELIALGAVSLAFGISRLLAYDWPAGQVLIATGLLGVGAGLYVIRRKVLEIHTIPEGSELEALLPKP